MKQENSPPRKARSKTPRHTPEFAPLTAKDLIQVLGLTIKHDNENKLVTFLCMLSAYTEDSQFNVSYNAPSSTGKSYIPIEIANLFPPEDVHKVGYSSPKAFFHDGRQLSKKKDHFERDLSRKIMIFLDQPHMSLLERLRPLLSHDEKEITMKITDKSQKSGLRTKTVLVKGFPAVIFCSAGMHIDEQEGTRFWLLSPEMNQEKLRESILEKIKRETDSQEYLVTLGKNPERQKLQARIRAIKAENIRHITIADPDLLKKLFFEKRDMLKPRHQRDAGRVISLVKTLALLNLWHREKTKNTVIANKQDILEAIRIWNNLAVCQENNLPPFLYNFYREVILAAYAEKNSNADEASKPQGVTKEEIFQKYFEVYQNHLQDWLLRQQFFPQLQAAGFISLQPMPGYKVKQLIIPRFFPSEK